MMDMWKTLSISGNSTLLKRGQAKMRFFPLFNMMGEKLLILDASTSRGQEATVSWSYSCNLCPSQPLLPAFSLPPLPPIACVPC